jgi:hypothetical protein
MDKLNKELIPDENVRNCFRVIEEEINQKQPLLKGNWARLDLTIEKAVTAYKFKHNLGFIPTDVFVTYADNSGYTLLYSQFDKDYIYITTTGANTLRGFMGRYEE